MSSGGGDWIKLHRSSLDSTVFDDDFTWRLWCWCLMKANFKDGIFRGMAIKKGQFVSGRLRGSGDLGCSQSKWMRGIEKLKSLGCISTKANNKWTVITVSNYSTYQDGGSKTRTTSGQPADNQRTQSKKDKNEKKNNNQEDSASTTPTLDEIISYSSSRNSSVSAEEFYLQYQSTGWMAGGSRIKNWKTLFQKWELNQSKPRNGKPPLKETSRTMEEIIADDERREKEQEQQA